MRAGKLKAARVGAGRNLLFCEQWCDQWLLATADERPPATVTPMERVS